MTKKPVVLVGPMGVGKTTVGKKLAKRLDLPFVDTDLVITKNHGDISAIFADRGEAAFREIESDVLVSLLNEPAVISTGGGAVLHEKSREALSLATVVYLSTDGKHIASRLKGGNRPLIKNGISDLRTIYKSRKVLYVQVAYLSDDISNSSLVQTIEAILEGLNNQNARA